MRRPFRSAAIFIPRKARSLSSCGLLLCFALLSQTAHTQITTPKEKPMKHYALVFHSTRTLTPAEQKQRPVDIASWVKQVTDMGITLDSRVLGETEAAFSALGSEAVTSADQGAPQLVTIVFFDSVDRDRAEKIAGTHPGPRYGVAVELREWTSPRQSVATQ
jgi:hypothetical protein